MTAKRFNYENDKIIDDIGHRCIIAFAYSEENAKVLCEMLNEVNDENEQLKHDASVLIYSNQEYRRENEQLRKELTDCEKFRHTVFKTLNKVMTDDK